MRGVSPHWAFIQAFNGGICPIIAAAIIAPPSTMIASLKISGDVGIIFIACPF